MKAKHNRTYRKRRDKIISLWDENNIFDNSHVDMAGLKITKKNYMTTHHIYYRNGKYYELAVVGRLLHDYIDGYLRSHNKHQYKSWNYYFSAVLNYASKYTKPDISEELMLARWRNNLLQKSLMIHDKKSEKFVTRIRPLVIEQFSSVFFSSSYSNDDYIPHILLFGNDISVRNCEIIVNDFSGAVNKYRSRKIENKYCINNKYLGTFEEMINKNKVKNDDVNAANAKYKESNDYDNLRKYDWMGVEVTLDNISCVKRFLTTESRSILKHLRLNNELLYKEWKKYFRCIFKNDISQDEIKEMLSDLRIKTFSYFQTQNCKNLEGHQQCMSEYNQNHIYNNICFDMYDPETEEIVRTRK